MKTQNTVQAVTLPMGMVPMGTIVAFALSSGSVPDGWLLCDGSPIPDKYSDLKTMLGSSTTPNLTGRIPLGAGTPVNDTQTDSLSPDFPSGTTFTTGTTGGQYQTVLGITQIPSHQHYGFGESGNSNWSTGNTTSNTINKGYSGCGKSDSNNYLWGSTFTGGNPENIYTTSNGTVTGASPGDTSAHYNMQPYYVVNYIIYTGA